MESSKPDFLHILITLKKYEVDFIIVGGVCGVLHGAPISTFDLDLVHSRDSENVDRLLNALEELQTCYRDPGGRLIKPKKSNLVLAGHHLLMTKSGPLDLLGEIGKNKDYIKLIKNATSLEIAKNIYVSVLKLETLIETKEQAAREKDKAVIAILRRTLEEQNG